MCVYVCVCSVWIIWTGVKHFFRFGFICRGRQGRCMAVAKEAPCSWLGYHGWSPWRTCYQSISLSDMGRGSTQEPPRRFWSLISCTVFAIWFCLNWKLQQPSVRMSTESFLWISHPFLSGELDCFLHVGYAPLHNSQWQFWASVVVICKCMNSIQIWINCKEICDIYICAL